jgi:spermidine synthase
MRSKFIWKSRSTSRGANLYGTELISRPYLYFSVFAAGLTTLAVELTASRLLGAVFGVSNLVWASIIGLILIYLTFGYFIGGWVADRWPQAKILYTLMAWGAFMAGLVPLASRPVLLAAAQAFDFLEMGVLFGSFTAVLILFSVPITLLGMMSPYAIRLAIREPEEAGRVSGRVYAVSTLGSFIGTFLPVLLFIPLIGTTRTFLVFSAFLLLVAFIGLGLTAGWKSVVPWLWMPILLVLLTLLVSGTPIKNTQGQIYEGESAYNYIEVLERDGQRILRLNEGQGEHSRYHPEILTYGGPWEQFLVAPFFNPPPHNPGQVESIAIVGLAAGTTARQATAVFGPIPIVGYEIDPEIIQVGQEYFDMNQPNLEAIAEDGRTGLSRDDSTYSLIGLDAYRPPYIPWHLTTQEFFMTVYERLEVDGVLVVNAGRAPGDRRMVDGLVATISTIFPSVFVMDLPASFNSIIYATVQPTTVDNLIQNYLDLSQRGDVHPLLTHSIRLTLENMQPTPEGGVVFTDDLAPIEWITNQMVLNYVLSGGVEELQ